MWEDGSGQMGVDGKYVGGKDGGLLVAAVLVNVGQQEEVKGNAKGGSKNAHLTDLDKNDELAGMLSYPNKGLSEYGGGDATRMVVEGGKAPCKTATMVEEVGAIGKMSTKVGKGWWVNKKNPFSKQQKTPDTMNKVSILCYGKLGFVLCTYFLCELLLWLTYCMFVERRDMQLGCLKRQ